MPLSNKGLANDPRTTPRKPRKRYKRQFYPKKKEEEKEEHTGVMCCFGCCRWCQQRIKAMTSGPKFQNLEEYDVPAGIDIERKKISSRIESDGSMGNGSIRSYKTIDDTPAPFGRLRFRIEYDFLDNILRTRVLQAEGLPAMDAGGTSDPYVKVYLKPDKKQKYETKIRRKTLNPVFNESFSFSVPYNETSFNTLVFAIYDYDKLSRDDRMGQVTIALNTVDLASTIEEWRIVEPPLEEQDMAERLGDLCFSIRYRESTGKFTVTILEGRNLKKMDITGSSDPYVKIKAYQDRKLLKKAKTTVKKQTLQPYYNESFVFVIPPAMIDRVHIELSVWDYDALSSNDFIGRILLGGKQCGAHKEVTVAGMNHWQEMRTSKRPVAHWHTLQAKPENETGPNLFNRISGKLLYFQGSASDS